MKQNRLMLILFVFFVVMPLWMRYSPRDIILEKDFNRKYLKLRDSFKDNNTEASFDLRSVFGNDWEMVCFQGPYCDQEIFENYIGRKVKWFKYRDDNDNLALWVFYIDGTSRWVEIPRLEDMKLRLRGCTKIDNPYVYVVKRSYFTPAYYLIKD